MSWKSLGNVMEFGFENCVGTLSSARVPSSLRHVLFSKLAAL